MLEFFTYMWQTPATIANPATGFSAGYRYEFAMAPATLALKYVDEQANANWYTSL